MGKTRWFRYKQRKPIDVLIRLIGTVMNSATVSVPQCSVVVMVVLGTWRWWSRSSHDDKALVELLERQQHGSLRSC